MSGLGSRGIVLSKGAYQLLSYHEANFRLSFCMQIISHANSHGLPMSGQQRYEGDSICNEIALITPPTHGLELYTINGMKDQGFTFRMVHKTLFYHFYLSSYRLSKRNTNIHCIGYIFIRIEKKYFNKVKKVRCTFLKKRLTTINGTYIVFKFNSLIITKIILTSDKY